MIRFLSTLRGGAVVAVLGILLGPTSGLTACGDYTVDPGEDCDHGLDYPNTCCAPDCT
jgi:hypothetical protein